MAHFCLPTQDNNQRGPPQTKVVDLWGQDKRLNEKKAYTGIRGEIGLQHGLLVRKRGFTFTGHGKGTHKSPSRQFLFILLQGSVLYNIHTSI
ncbi:hypothetical protein L195_g018956 [Trifolium pratense]|uniref:Uncharacterized protein n=1 Tax=Trifolium pratense TaxID=57577 RepID=A0A2K3MYB3_TRIPR|nr:hypothetical protein L195_g018956 [Trifolium pratense]